LNIPVIYSTQPAEQTVQERGLLTDFWGPGLTKQPDKQPILEKLEPTAGNHLLTKYRYSAFHRTELRSLLQREGRDQLIICGIYAHLGCLLTACESFMNDIQPFLVADAVADFSAENHHLALNYAAQSCGVTLTSAQLIQELQRYEQPGDQQPETTLRDQNTAKSGSAKSMTGLRAQLANLLECTPQEIGTEDNLLELGLDSIRLMSLIESWRHQGVEVDFADLAEQPTLSQWERLLSEQAAKGGQHAYR
jgi:bifunctional isochorismate lyase / aryl carrier protein